MKTKFMLSLVVVATLFILPVSIVLAQGQAYAFGYKNLNLLKGVRVYLWTGTPPNGQAWTAAPVGMCKYVSCNGAKIETGWIKGTEYGLGDQLHQYMSRTLDTGGYEFVSLGTLSENTWYQVKTMWSDSAHRWEVWLFNDVPWYGWDYWQRGEVAVVGSENRDSGGWMGVWGWHPEYALTGVGWTLYNYDYSATGGGGHIIPAYDFGYGAWGP